MRYKDPQLSIAERVSDLLGRMTLAEKIAQMYSHWLILSPDGNHRIRTDCLRARCNHGRSKRKTQGGSGANHPPSWHPSRPSQRRGARSECPAKVSGRGNPAWHSGHVSRRMFGGADGQRRYPVPSGLELWFDLESRAHGKRGPGNSPGGKTGRVPSGIGAGSGCVPRRSLGAHGRNHGGRSLSGRGSGHALCQGTARRKSRTPGDLEALRRTFFQRRSAQSCAGASWLQRTQ